LFAGEAPGAPDVLVLGDALGAGVDVLLCARSDGLETLAVLGVLGTAPSAGNADDEDAGPCLTGVVVAALWPLPGTVLQVDALCALGVAAGCVGAAAAVTFLGGVFATIIGGV
jgi:hypothetical protein